MAFNTFTKLTVISEKLAYLGFNVLSKPPLRFTLHIHHYCNVMGWSLLKTSCLICVATFWVFQSCRERRRALQNLIGGGGLSQYMGEYWGRGGGGGGGGGGVLNGVFKI